MYSQTAQVSGYGRGNGVQKRLKKRSRKGPEQTRLSQLLVCLVLFLTVFIGKGVFPSKLLQVRDDILTMISSDTDFRAAFSKLGESFSAGENTFFGRLGDFCVEVFGPAEIQQELQEGEFDTHMTSLLTEESQFFSTSPTPQELSQHYFIANAPILVSNVQSAQASAAPASEPEEEPEAVAAVGTVLLKSNYNGQALPENYTMDQLSLGELQTTVPVLGHLNSPYGYRDHPINGQYQFHGGVDIGGQMGDPIHAFAAGTVEYVGEDDSYGLYLQVDHGNGIKSFYAHCLAVCVSTGQAVAMGEKIAEVGASGAATGPHLHLELKCNGVHLDPAYYVEFLTDQ